ncbi:bifunctional [glutamate--ammonia ligase]-adenylyl-L-tyrosine phosphorylase/[glutamate--ammonia-ligase] adenylyltransferase [Oligella ureolytica]
MGKCPLLRQASFFKALEAETQAGIIDEAQKQLLEEAYRFLRRLEHLLQYKNDQQTHLLPDNDEDLNHLAELFSLDLGEFQTQLNQHRQAISHSFKEAFRIIGVEVEQTPKIEPILGTHGIESAEQQTEQSANGLTIEDKALLRELEPMLESLRQSYKIKNLNPQAKNRLDALIPKMIEAATKTQQPVSTFSRLMDLIDNVVQRSSYMALLNEYPEVLSRIARMLNTSPWVANYITNNPIVLDRLIDWHELLEPINIDEIIIQLQHNLDASVLEDGSPDMELQMNLMRDLKKQITFQLLAQDIEGVITVEHLADVLSLLADKLLEESMKRVWPLVCRTL